LIFWAAAIFLMSSFTPGGIQKVTAPIEGLPALIAPTFVHLTEYALLAMLAYRLFRYGLGLRPPLLWAAAVLAASLYGVSDELHQRFVPGRYSTWQDALVDVIGAVAGVAIIELTALGLRRMGRRKLQPAG